MNASSSLLGSTERGTSCAPAAATRQGNCRTTVHGLSSRTRFHLGAFRPGLSSAMTWQGARVATQEARLSSCRTAALKRLRTTLSSLMRSNLACLRNKKTRTCQDSKRTPPLNFAICSAWCSLFAAYTAGWRGVSVWIVPMSAAWPKERDTRQKLKPLCSRILITIPGQTQLRCADIHVITACHQTRHPGEPAWRNLEATCPTRACSTYPSAERLAGKRKR